MGDLNRESQERLMRERQRQAYLARKRIKKEKKRKTIKIVIFILVFVLAFVFYQSGFHFDLESLKEFKINIFGKNDKDSSKKKASYKSSMEGEVVAYVPLDDRPIHTSRIQALAKSEGFEMKLPDAKYYKTHLESGENSYPTYNTKYGNPERISSWLLQLDKEGCNYYIISIDQLFSGGLVSSQYVTDEDIELYGQEMEFYLNTIKKLLSDKKNHIYFIDSINGLTITPGYLGLTEDDEKNIKEFASVERKELTESSLTIDSISDGYKVDKNGKGIETTIDEVILNKYLEARTRKLSYSQSILKLIGKSKNKNIHIYVGIDSNKEGKNTIQENDIAFMKKTASENNVKIIMRENVSTLSEVAFADMELDAVEKTIKVKVSYYGDEKQKIAGTDVSYKEYMDELLKDLNLSAVDSKEDFDILVYHSAKENNKENANNLINQYLENIHNKVPTVIINDADLVNDPYLINTLINYKTKKIPLGYLIGYSNWNGFMNSSRIGVAEGVTRILYLKGINEKKENMDKGFLETMGLSFTEDMGYLPYQKTMTDVRQLEKEMNKTNTLVLENLSNSNFISDLISYDETGIRYLTISSYSFPWNRPNEISIKLYAYTEDRHPITIPKSFS